MSRYIQNSNYYNTVIRKPIQNTKCKTKHLLKFDAYTLTYNSIESIFVSIHLKEQTT